MGTVKWIVVVMAVFASNSLAVIIVPTPTVRVDGADSSTVAIGWTMPINEDYDNFTIEVRSENELVQEFTVNATLLTVENLTPGVMYNISVSAQRGMLRSDVAFVTQDTVPLPGSNLVLSCFDELVLTFEGPFFNDQFTLPVAGIEAQWKAPDTGRSDCYDVEIEPSDGHTASPANPNTEVDPGSTLRQFIQLTTGQTYTITVYSSTCGEGYLGKLRSLPISKSLTLPPASPPPITPEKITNSSADLLWTSEEISGFFDDFELIHTSGQQSDVTIVEPADLRTQGRNVTDLEACTRYDFQLFTLYQERRSKRSQNTTFFTRPTPPNNLRIFDVQATSATFTWNLYGKQTSSQFKVFIRQLGSTQNIKAKRLRLTNLSPSTTYSVAVSTICAENPKLESSQLVLEFTTKPLPPQSIDVTCSVRNNNEFVKRSSGESVLRISWNLPKEGSWDGFLVDHSPHQFEAAPNQPFLPVSVAASVSSLNISIPSEGRIMTVYVRTIKGNILSEAVVANTFCYRGEGHLIRHCRTVSPTWSIVITAVNASAHLLIEIINLPMHNATVVLPGNVIVTKEYTILVPNPCPEGSDEALSSRVMVTPACDVGSVCEVITRRLCVTSRKSSSAPTSCCSHRLYNTERWNCCHAELMGKSRPNMACCFTRWYDSSTHRCCAGEEDTTGIIRPIDSVCP